MYGAGQFHPLEVHDFLGGIHVGRYFVMLIILNFMLHWCGVVYIG